MKSNDDGFWKRQSDIERFTNETRFRKMILEITNPILDNQIDLQTKIEKNIMIKLEDLMD